MTRRESLLACAGIIGGWLIAVAGHSGAHRLIVEPSCAKPVGPPPHHDPTDLPLDFYEAQYPERAISGRFFGMSNLPLGHINWLDGGPG